MNKFPHSEKLGSIPLEWYESTVRGWIGECQWPDVVTHFTQLQCTVCFEDDAEMYMLGEFGASILYDMTHKRGAWQARREADLAKHTEKAYNHGMAAGRLLADSGATKSLVYQGPTRFRDTFIEGMQSVMPPEMFEAYAGVDLERGTFEFGKDMYSSNVKH